MPPGHRRGAVSKSVRCHGKHRLLDIYTAARNNDDRMKSMRSCACLKMPFQELRGDLDGLKGYHMIGLPAHVTFRSGSAAEVLLLCSQTTTELHSENRFRKVKAVCYF
jgi:hypothetical protein